MNTLLKRVRLFDSAIWEDEPKDPGDQDEDLELGVLHRVATRHRDTRPRIDFHPYGTNNTAAARRASIIFEPHEIADRLTNRPLASGEDPFEPSGSLHPRAQPFELKPSTFLRLAQRMRPDRPEPTASAFAQWLYSLYGRATGDEEDRERGKAMEPAILERRRATFALADNDFLSRNGYDWRLIHNGLHVSDDDRPTYSSINGLWVNGQALRVSPDLAYRNERTGDVIIVEIKFSRMAIPTNLWPNIWGQLWCYAQIPFARAATNLTVIGEVWGQTRGHDAELYMRASVRRDPRDAAFDNFFRSLFDIYRGRSGLV
ncbi:hypothetical protein CBA19CS22_17985 [Caballeronia novacaledonica]|uniref:Uncharacterized protein n=1 Tax=Caballeronia novacaledonica TaxID=1544861 RepID=A0ACB5QU43_9BURK|nr:hypothetical protein CBA19CS22_17985 [Caballeronia novacaledonica]